MWDAIIFTECNGSIGWGRDAGAYTIASRLRAGGYSVRVIDFLSHFDTALWQQVIDQFVSPRTKFLGFSSTHISSLMPAEWESHYGSDNRTNRHDKWSVYFVQEPAVMEEWFNYAKRKAPNLKIVVGGQKVAQKECLQRNYPGVDIWIGGMADVSIEKVMQDLNEGGKVQPRIRSELEFGSISESDFSKSRIQWQEEDLLFAGESVPLEIARGCPFKCSFCDYRKKAKGSWIKDESALRDQLIEAWERWGIDSYMITDFIINESMQKMEMIWRVMTSMPFQPTWTGFGRLEPLSKHPEMIPMLRESGARAIQWGIESINGDVGKFIGKNTQQKFIEKLLTACRDQWGDEVVMGSGFIMGLPGETRASMQNTLQWLSSQPWLHGWEVTPLFIGKYDESRAYTIDYSRIQRSPESFGYTIEMLRDGNRFHEMWKNPNMDKRDAIDTIETFQKSSVWKKRSVATFHGYSPRGQES